MPYVDRIELKRMKQAHQLLASSGYDIIDALRVYAARMDYEAKEHLAAHAAGAETGLVTNEGYRVAGELFATKAERATALAEEIDNWGNVDTPEEPAPATLTGRLRPDLARPAFGEQR